MLKELAWHFRQAILFIKNLFTISWILQRKLIYLQKFDKY